MERGVATRGKVAKQIAGAEDIEIKATLPDHQIKSALTRFGLTMSNERRAHLHLFLRHAEARPPCLGNHHARAACSRPASRQHREVPPDQSDGCRSEVAPVPGFQDRGRRERDGHGPDGVVLDAGWQRPHQACGRRQKADRIAFHARPGKLSERSVAHHKIDFSKLVVLGPLIAQRWKFGDPGCPWPITAELWTRGDAKRMMEFSIKAPAVQAAAAVGGFIAFLAEVGAERDKNQQSKTRWALDYYVGKLKQAPAGKKAAVDKNAARKKAPTKKASQSPAKRASKRAA